MSDKEIVQSGGNMPAVSHETQAIMQMIEQIALNPDADVEKLRAVMDMKMQMFNRGAEIEFNAAMSRVQSEIAPVARTANNQQTRSKYALLETIIKQCSPIWTEHGFALTFGTGECAKDNHYRINCVVSHSAGHSREYHADLPTDMTGISGNANKTGIHGFGSTVSYGRRYLTCMIFNIATGDDNDGQAQQQPRQPVKQKEPIDDDRLDMAIDKINQGEYTAQRLYAAFNLTTAQKKKVTEGLNSGGHAQ